MAQLRRAAIVSPLRTPVGRFLGTLTPLEAGPLAAIIIKALVERSGVDPSRVDDVVFAQGYGSGEAPATCRSRRPASSWTGAAGRAFRP